MRSDLPEIYDDRPLRGPRPPRRVWPWLLVAIVVAVAVGATNWFLRRDVTRTPAPAPPPVHVVHDRPGGRVGQAEATLILRRHFAGQVPERCLATILNGTDGRVVRFTVFNTCARTRLGQWQVDGWTKVVSPRH